MKPGNMNRRPLDSPIFGMRGEEVKWPTIRKAWLHDDSVAEIKDFVIQRGKSIIFLDGTYRTNLNQWVKKDPHERAIFFEFLTKHPKVKGGIYLLSWVGNYHNGCIIHFAWQYPQVRCWYEAGTGIEEFFEKKAFSVYSKIVNILYDHSEHPMDEEVESFLKNAS